MSVASDFIDVFERKKSSSHRDVLRNNSSSVVEDCFPLTRTSSIPTNISRDSSSKGESSGAFHVREVDKTSLSSLTKSISEDSSPKESLSGAIHLVDELKSTHLIIESILQGSVPCEKSSSALHDYGFEESSSSSPINSSKPRRRRDKSRIIKGDISEIFRKHHVSIISKLNCFSFFSAINDRIKYTVIKVDDREKKKEIIESVLSDLNREIEAEAPANRMVEKSKTILKCVHDGQFNLLIINFIDNIFLLTLEIHIIILKFTLYINYLEIIVILKNIKLLD